MLFYWARHKSCPAPLQPGHGPHLRARKQQSDRREQRRTTSKNFCRAGDSLTPTVAAHVSMALLPQPVLASSGTQAGSLCRISRSDGVPSAA